MMTMRQLSFLTLVLFAATAIAEEPHRPPFRTDADGPVGQKPIKGAPPLPEWYQPVAGQFPPEGSAHAISGELIQVDHLERKFLLRVDRNDSQDRSIWDLPVDATMLPYGAIYYQGAPAAIQDIPLGTHLHGLFYLKDPNSEISNLDTPYGRKTPEFDFRQCFQLEDGFSYHARQNQLWKIESVNLPGMKLIATLQKDGQDIGKPQIFDLLTSTRVSQGRCFEDLNALQPGQLVLFNLTWATLYGPGRLTDIWLDEAARSLATQHQLERNRNHTRERGLAGWVDAVDDKTQIVTITFFGGVDPALFQDLALVDDRPLGWPLSKEPDDPNAPKGTIAVAQENLMTYDPVNDRKGGNILDIRTVPIQPGSSGVQICVKCDMLLEGYRPTRIVRVYPSAWKVQALPREEQYFGRE